MLALDTNVLVRYVVQDDKAQANLATKAVESLTPDAPAFIPCIVLCEFNWVLQSAYGISKKDRIAALQKILSVAVFSIEQLDACLQAVRLYETGPADFSDYLIRQISKKEGCEVVLTFDKNALKSESFKSP